MFDIRRPRRLPHAALALPLTCITLGLSLPASAATLPIYKATAGISGNNSPYVGGDTTVVNSAGSTFPDGRMAGAQSVAGPDGIGFSSSAGIPERDPSEAFDGVLSIESIAGYSGGSYYVDDLVFSFTGGDAAENNGFAEVSALFLLDGAMWFNQDFGANSSAMVTVGVSFGVGEPGTGVTAETVGLISRGRNRTEEIVRNEGVFSELGDDATMTIDGSYATDIHVVPLDKELVFTMAAGGRSTVVSRQDETAVSANLDFMHTFTLGNGSMIFDLPEGITVNSVRGGIVNNQFAAPSAVPLPPALPMMASAMVLLGVFRCRRRT